MIIQGAKLALTKKAFIAYVAYCSQKALSASDKETEKVWDPELKAADEMLKNIEHNLKQELIEVG